MNWVDYFRNLAHNVKLKSKDERTQGGISSSWWHVPVRHDSHRWRWGGVARAQTNTLVELKPILTWQVGETVPPWMRLKVWPQAHNAIRKGQDRSSGRVPTWALWANPVGNPRSAQERGKINGPILGKPNENHFTRFWLSWTPEQVRSQTGLWRQRIGSLGTRSPRQSGILSRSRRQQWRLRQQNHYTWPVLATPPRT